MESLDHTQLIRFGAVALIGSDPTTFPTQREPHITAAVHIFIDLATATVSGLAGFLSFTRKCL